MALNWALISDDGARPVPLPGEKIFFAVQTCSLSLDFKQHGVKWTANGDAYVTSQRILFLRQPPLPAPADASTASAHLRTLSVPLKQFLDTRYLIPVFTAPFYEAHVVPSVDGGLPQRSASAGHASNNVGLLKLWFNEGGGMAFRDAVEEVKSRLEEGATHVEALPMYEPPPPGTSIVDGGAGQHASVVTTESNPASYAHSPRAPRPTRSDSMPMPEDLEAARVAREAEERERDEERERVRGTNAPSASDAGGHLDEQPPPYIAA